jgi:hypothetical protein
MLGTKRQMAQILERLGPPEAVAAQAGAPAPGSAPAGAAPPIGFPDAVSRAANAAEDAVRPPRDLGAEARFLDRVWIACFVGVLGLYVPIVDLFLCNMVSMVLLASAFGSSARSFPEAYRGIRTLAWWSFALIALLFPVGLLSLVAPSVSILGMMIGIGDLVLSLLVYWKLMTGTADWVQHVEGGALSEWILTVRQYYLIANIGLLLVAILVGVLLGVSLHPKVRIVTDLIMPIFILPLGWGIGYFYLPRPIARARDALRAAAQGAPANAEA